MSILRVKFFGVMLLCLAIGGRVQAQIYYSASSANLSLNTVDGVTTNGSANTVLVSSGNGLVTRCTAVAVDGLHGKLFFLDSTAGNLLSVNLDGSGETFIKSGLTNFPTDLALDVLNQKIYYSTSSTIQSNNTVQRMDYTGNNNGVLFTATGAAGNGVSRCTAIAVDISHSKIFIADAGAQKIWSMGLAGTGLAALVTTSTNTFPTGLTLDVTNQQVYFTVGSSIQSSNRIQRMNYAGAGLATLFTASGSVRCCTALDLDLAHALIYLSDAGAGTLWKIPLGGGSATSILSGLSATAKKVRWFNGPNSYPAPSTVGISVNGSNIVLNATNGFIGGTYYLLSATNLNTPLSQWLRLNTNLLSANGSFSITGTNVFSKNSPRRFFLLQVH